MSANRAGQTAFGITVFLVVFALGLWFCGSDSHVRVASAFSTEDVRAIRRAVSDKCWMEFRKSIAAHNLKRTWNFALPVLLSRTESIAGFPGPPGGAQVACRSVFFDTECSFMIFNTTNGWKCASIEFIDAQALLQIREMQRQFASQQH